MWDHLVQDQDSTKANFGQLSEHPRKININVYSDEEPRPVSKEEIEQMKQMGVLTSNASVENRGSDITHMNAIDYNADFDQIVLSSRFYEGGYRKLWWEMGKWRRPSLQMGQSCKLRQRHQR